MPRLFLSSVCLLGAASVFACGTDQRQPFYDGFISTGGSASGGSGSTDGDGLAGVVIPTTIEAEYFVRAYESDPSQEGDEVCQSAVDPGVDISSAETVSGGCSVGYATAGEWLEYDIAVAETAAFDFVLQVGTDIAGKTLSISIDGEYRGTIEIPITGWTDFSEVTLSGIGITEGNHVLRVTFDSGGVNLDYIRVESAGACVPACEGKSCGSDFCGGDCGSCSDGESCISGGQCRAPQPPAVKTHGQLSIKDGKLVDESGAAVQLRGVSTQWLNWEQDYSTSKEALEFMRDSWGLEVLRVANGVENSNGYAEAPEERMAMVKQIIDNAIELDVYVLVDWHTHDPSYLDLAKDFFADIAKTYGDKPHIIYEPFNEPLGESGAEETFWANELKPYHEAIVKTIRAKDPDNVIVLGTPRWSQFVDVAALDPVAGDNLAYTLHFYSCTHTDWLRQKAQSAIDAGAALFVTEWASTHADGGTAANPGTCTAAADAWHSFLNDNFVSSAAWKLNADGDASAILKFGASLSGGWTDAQLSDHGKYVRDLLQQSRPAE